MAIDRNKGRASFFTAVGPGGVFPDGSRPEIMFCGRSNVGKSSLLNALTGVKGLARTSKTPGRTREIHFYRQGEDRFLVDLPGYGYAKASIQQRRSWQQLVEAYLDRADRIALAILLVDARHPPFETDLLLSKFLASRCISVVIALTKTDRSTMSERTVCLRSARASFPGADGWIMTSSKTGAGIKELSRRIDHAASRARGSRIPALQWGSKSGKINELQNT